MKKKLAFVEQSKCDNSPFCAVIRICPQKAVARTGSVFAGAKPEVDVSECKGCGICTQHCPHSAVRMRAG